MSGEAENTVDYEGEPTLDEYQKLKDEHAEMLEMLKEHQRGYLHKPSTDALIARIEGEACYNGHAEYVDGCEGCKRVPWDCPTCGKKGRGFSVHTCYVKLEQ